MAKIAVITPVSHLNGVIELLESKGKVFLYEDASKDKVRSVLLNSDIDTILCNPNQQTYKINKELLEGTNVKLINTCSTGMNHIDVNYCNENNLDYNLSASEYAMENSYLILEELMNKIQSLDGIVFYSLFQLPEDKNYRKKIYKNVLKKNKKIYFSVENYKFLSKNDIIDLENIWDIKSILPKCYKG